MSMDFDRLTSTYNVHNIEYSNVPCECEAEMISFQLDSVNLFLVIGNPVLSLFFRENPKAWPRFHQNGPCTKPTSPVNWSMTLTCLQSIADRSRSCRSVDWMSICVLLWSSWQMSWPKHIKIPVCLLHGPPPHQYLSADRHCFEFGSKLTWSDTTNPWTNLSPVAMRNAKQLFCKNSPLQMRCC